MAPDLDLSTFADAELRALSRAHLRLSAEEETAPWLRRFGWAVGVLVENELGARRTAWHALTAELEFGRLVDPGESLDDGDSVGDV